MRVLAALFALVAVGASVGLVVELRRAPHCGGAAAAIAAPRIAYTDDTGLYVRSVDGGAPCRLAALQLAAPTWSPDGTRIAAIEIRPGGREDGRDTSLVRVFAADGAIVATLLDVGGFADPSEGIRWAHDGRSIDVEWAPPQARSIIDDSWTRIDIASGVRTAIAESRIWPNPSSELTASVDSDPGDVGRLTVCAPDACSVVASDVRRAATMEDLARPHVAWVGVDRITYSADDGSAAMLSIRTLMISTRTSAPTQVVRADVLRRFAPGTDGRVIAGAPVISPDGERAAVGRKQPRTDDGTLEIVDLATGDVLASVPNWEPLAGRVKWTADSSIAVLNQSALPILRPEVVVVDLRSVTDGANVRFLGHGRDLDLTSVPGPS